MIKSVKQELLYCLKAKVYLKMLILLAVLFCLIIFMNYNAITSSYSEYLHYVEYANDSGMDADEVENGDFKVVDNGNSGTVENPLAYAKYNVGKFVYAFSPKYIISEFLESSVLFYPVVFGLFGVMIGCYDIKNHTIRIKTVRKNKKVFSWAKQLSLPIGCIIISILALLIASIVAFVFYKIVCGKVPAADFAFDTRMCTGNVFLQALVSFLISVVFSEIGYAFGFIFKSPIVGAGTITVYTFIVPNLGRYDIKNCIYYLMKKVSDCLGVISIHEPKETTFSISICTILLFAVVPFVINSIIEDKRSSYNC